MKVAYIDPGLQARAGHNGAMLEEFDQALAAERGHSMHCLVGGMAQDADWPGLHSSLIRTNALDGYSQLPAADTGNHAALDRLIARAVEEWRNLGVLDSAELILMPTAYPIHLAALARLAPALRGRRLVIGMLMSPSFWCRTSEGERLIGQMMAQSLDTLAQSTDLLVYSETGRLDLAGLSVNVPTLLPPLAARSGQRMDSLASRSGIACTRELSTIGFFGSPFTGKGFGVLMDAIDRLAVRFSSPTLRLVFRLPSGFDEISDRLNALAPWIDARSCAMSNSAYLEQMAAVDAVHCFYDPAQYAGKMSGILVEALALGRPVVLADGCEAMIDFVERHAPGSYVSGPYAAQTLEMALAMPLSSWRRIAECAHGSAAGVRALKSMSRFLAVCGLH